MSIDVSDRKEIPTVWSGTADMSSAVDSIVPAITDDCIRERYVVLVERDLRKTEPARALPEPVAGIVECKDATPEVIDLRCLGASRAYRSASEFPTIVSTDVIPVCRITA